MCCQRPTRQRWWKASWSQSRQHVCTANPPALMKGELVTKQSARLYSELQPASFHSVHMHFSVALFTKHTIKKDCLLAVTGKDNTLFNIWLQQILFCFSKKKKKKVYLLVCKNFCPRSVTFWKDPDEWSIPYWSVWPRTLDDLYATYFGRSLWPRTLDDLYGHVLWTIFMTTYFGRSLWPRTLDDLYDHVLWTQKQ